MRHTRWSVDLVVAGSAGEGFIRHMRERGAARPAF